MQLLKKVVSLLLVVAMLGSFTLVASADDGDSSADKVVLKLLVSDENGEALPAGNKVQVGDRIKVQLVPTNKGVDLSAFHVFIRYNADVFSCVKKDCHYSGVVADQDYDLSTIQPIEETQPNQVLSPGDHAVTFSFVHSTERITYPANTPMAEMTFTAKAAADTTQIEVILVTAGRLLYKEDGSLDTATERCEYEFTTPENATLTVEAAQVAAEGISLDKDTLTVVRGKSEELKATVTPANATDEVTWESSAPDVATVENGIVAGVSTGEATITAKAGSHTAECRVTVEWIPVDTVSLNVTSRTVNKHATYQLIATVTPDNASDKTVTWTSDAPEIAEVDQSGLVSGIKAGKANVTAKAGDKEVTIPITVKEIKAKSVTLKDVAVNLSGTATVTLTLKPYNCTNVSETVWKVVDGEDIVELTPNGKAAVLKGKKNGVATIQATLDGITKTAKVTVSNPITSVVVEGPSKLEKGQSAKFTATISLADDSAESTDDVTLTWHSSAPQVADIDADGKVTAKATGTATIYATVNGKEYNHTLYVVGQGDDAYQVSMPADATVTSGDTIEVPVTVSSETTGVTQYSAFDITVSYDPSALELLTGALGDYTVKADSANGTIRVLGWGQPKDLGPVFTLQFKANLTQGSTTVSLDSAKVDVSDNALTSDAPEAAKPKASTGYTVSVKHALTFGTGFDVSGTVNVEHGENYTFAVTDYDPYYNYTVTATKSDATTVNVVDNGNGSYKIENVSCDLSITVTKDGRTYKVTLPTGVSGNPTAKYQENYKFQVDKTGDDPNTNYEVTFTVGSDDTKYTPEGPDSDGNYVISGDKIKGDITITVTKTPILDPDTYNVTVDGNGASDVTAEKTAKKDMDFSFQVKLETGYVYSAEIQVGATTYKEGQDLTYLDLTDGTVRTYTLKGDKITGNLLITVTKQKAYDVTFEVDDKAAKEIHGLPNASKKAIAGSDYSFTVTSFNVVYNLVAEVTENGVKKDITITRASGAGKTTNVTCTIKDVQGDLHVKLSYVANTDKTEVIVSKFVELDDKTVFLVATHTKSDAEDVRMQLDTFDGHAMYETSLYVNCFNSPKSNARTYVWLVMIDKGKAFTAEDALEHLSYTARRVIGNAEKYLPLPDVIGTDEGDVNGSGTIDVNDAQLVYDIYNAKYDTFCMTNHTGNTYEEPQIGATMTKFLMADVNRDMCVNSTDAAAVVDMIKK